MMLEHVPEPHRLFLTWQPAAVKVRHRRVVAELIRHDGSVIFRYLFDTPDFKMAREEGFSGFPAFEISTEEHRNSVLEAFMRRLPPRKRDDYSLFLKQHLLPEDFSGSDFALLGITGARLPSDTFELTSDLEGLHLPQDLLLMVAGHRHYAPELLKPIEIGADVRLAAEPDNPVDPNAIRVESDAGLLGYVNRAVCFGLKRLLASAKVDAHIARINGTTENPKVYVIARLT